jgi:hypothetical protein
MDRSVNMDIRCDACRAAPVTSSESLGLRRVQSAETFRQSLQDRCALHIARLRPDSDFGEGPAAADAPVPAGIQLADFRTGRFDCWHVWAVYSVAAMRARAVGARTWSILSAADICKSSRVEAEAAAWAIIGAFLQARSQNMKARISVLTIGVADLDRRRVVRQLNRSSIPAAPPSL